jgi:hypothetical protein
MRPVRFVALSEDGQALVLADEVGRLLTLPIDDRFASMMRTDRGTTRESYQATGDEAPSLAPRDIQARIRSGESAEDVARIAGVPVDRVLRYAGPVLQERAMLAQHARRTRLKTSDKGVTLAEVVDARLSQHGVDMEKISWDAYRRDVVTWRVVATWPSGKANATAVWELDKARQLVAPQDDMAHYLCGSGASHQEAHRGHEVAPPRPERGGHEPIYPGVRDTRRPTQDPIRAGREALLASLERPLGTPPSRRPDPLDAPAASAASAAATGEAPRRRPGGRSAMFEDERDTAIDVPAVPSLAVLRPRRTAVDAPPGDRERPVKRGPSWDDVLFGAAPAAKDA